MPTDLTETRNQSTAELFPPNREEALERLSRFLPKAGADYRKMRNFDFGRGQHGCVSQLSPYIRNGTLSEAEAVAATLRQHSYTAAEKFIQEVFWRVYWKGYLQNTPDLWSNYCDQLRTLKATGDKQKPLAEAESGTTGIDCFDTWSRELIDTGYLHNHARMWFASIWIFTLKLPWQLGADFFLRHLLDGDPASNTLSWRWVAGLHTKGKTYLARPSNIARYTSDRFEGMSGLATKAEPLSEPCSPNRETFDTLPPPPKALTKGHGLIILDEDLRRHIDEILPDSAILGLYPRAHYSQSGIATSVGDFRLGCLTDALDCLQSDYKCQTEFMTDPTAEAIDTWARRNQVDTLLLARPQIGPWNDIWTPLAKQLEAIGLKVNYFSPWWENELYPQATHGFFKFKKNIRAIADRMASENTSAVDGS